MPLSDSILSYADCRELCDQALASERGIKFRVSTGKTPEENASGANRFMQRLNQHRRLDRASNKRLYTEADPLYGRSAYDNLEFRTRGAEVQILKISSRVNDLKIEPLTEEEIVGIAEPRA
jgi:hypothetical protein